MPVLSYVHELFNVDQCHAYIHTPTVCFDAIPLLISIYGYNSGQIAEPVAR